MPQNRTFDKIYALQRKSSVYFYNTAQIEIYYINGYFLPYYRLRRMLTIIKLLIVCLVFFLLQQNSSVDLPELAHQQNSVSIQIILSI